jgi:hypothetical protein
VTQANGRECALDGVGGPQVSPVLCGEVVEGEVVSGHVSGHRGVPLTDLQPGAVGQHDPQGRVGPRHRPDAHGGEGGTIRFRLDPDLHQAGPRPGPGRHGNLNLLAQRSSDDREIPSRRQNSPDVPVQPRNRTSRSSHSARHSALNRLAIATLLNRNPGQSPENRPAYAGGQEWCRLALTSLTGLLSGAH